MAAKAEVALKSNVKTAFARMLTHDECRGKGLRLEMGLSEYSRTPTAYAELCSCVKALHALLADQLGIKLK